MPLHIIRQDITTVNVDAIVNTTNERMVGYSGIDRLVHQKAGPGLDAACRELAPLELGFAKITPGFSLPCKYIIHTSGPVWKGGGYGERAVLRSCYLESLGLAKAQGCETVAFPLISSGYYGYPKDQVLRQAVAAISEYLKYEELTVFLCVFDPASYEFSRSLYADISRFINASSLPLPQMARPQMARRPLIPRKEKAAPCEAIPEAMPCTMPCPGPAGSLSDFLETMDAGFAETLFALIDAKGMTDVECYKRANVDKKTFSKIKCKPDYRPSKPTAVAFCIALRLNLEETQQLLRTVGMTLSRSNKFDLIIEYFIAKGIYDIYEINQALFEFDQVLLGC
ncbi:MAG: macro domain-containing protein [Eubacteriales bacterium]|nr:macro domain-containing protein [Eubacteriales bacterium]